MVLTGLIIITAEEVVALRGKGRRVQVWKLFLLGHGASQTRKNSRTSGARITKTEERLLLPGKIKNNFKLCSEFSSVVRVRSYETTAVRVTAVAKSEWLHSGVPTCIRLTARTRLHSRSDGHVPATEPHDASVSQVIPWRYLLAVSITCPVPNIEDHHLSAVRDCLFHRPTSERHLFHPEAEDTVQELLYQKRVQIVPTIISATGVIKKKFWGELIAYLPLIRHGPLRKRRLQFFIAAGTSLQSCYLTTIGG
jgi:hypothetical protein